MAEETDISSLVTSVRDYLSRGGLEEDVRYAVGPHAYEGLSRLAQLFNTMSPGADVVEMKESSEDTMSALRSGDYSGAAASAAMIPATMAMMAVPGTTRGVEEAISPLRRLVDNLPEDTKKSIPAQPKSKKSVYGYHGTVGPREGDEFFDVSKAREQDEFLGKGFYFTIDPDIAAEYANMRAIKNLQDVPAGIQGIPKGAMRTPDGQIVTTDTILKGQDIEGNPILAGQNIARFDLGGIENPYVVRSNKDRLWAKANADKLKEQGFDSILYDDLSDRSKQIMVFPENINKVKSMKSGGLVTRNPYNRQPKAI